MSTTADMLRGDSGATVEFLRKTVPFDELDDEKLRELSQHFVMKSFPAETVIFRQDIDEVNDFYLICKGSVKAYLTGPDGAETLLDFRGEGGYFGALAIIRGSKANFNVVALEDTFCLGVGREVFLDLIRTYPRFSQYYLKKFSEDLVTTAYAELRWRKIRTQSGETLYQSNVQVGDVITRPPEIVAASQSIQQAARHMAELDIGSLLIRDQSGEISGIVTDEDLRKKVVAKGHDYNAPVATIMSSPVRAIPSNSLCFDALLRMMREHVQHLAVERGKQIVGVVSVRDIMVREGASPLYLVR